MGSLPSDYSSVDPTVSGGAGALSLDGSLLNAKKTLDKATTSRPDLLHQRLDVRNGAAGEHVGHISALKH